MFKNVITSFHFSSSPKRLLNRSVDFSPHAPHTGQVHVTCHINIFHCLILMLVNLWSSVTKTNTNIYFLKKHILNACKHTGVRLREVSDTNEMVCNSNTKKRKKFPQALSRKWLEGNTSWLHKFLYAKTWAGITTNIHVSFIQLLKILSNW